MIGKSYYKRPHRLRAVQFDGFDAREIEEFTGMSFRSPLRDSKNASIRNDPAMRDNVRIDGKTAFSGDYIVDFGDSQNSLFHIMKPDLFEAIYQEDKTFNSYQENKSDA